MIQLVPPSEESRGRTVRCHVVKAKNLPDTSWLSGAGDVYVETFVARKTFRTKCVYHRFKQPGDTKAAVVVSQRFFFSFTGGNSRRVGIREFANSSNTISITTIIFA